MARKTYITLYIVKVTFHIIGKNSLIIINGVDSAPQVKSFLGLPRFNI